MPKTPPTLLRKDAKDYLEMEGGHKVLSLRLKARGPANCIYLGITEDPKLPEWWVIGGRTIMNLYSKAKYPTIGAVVKAHRAVVTELIGRQDAKVASVTDEKLKYFSEWFREGIGELPPEVRQAMAVVLGHVAKQQTKVESPSSHWDYVPLAERDGVVVGIYVRTP